MKTVVIASPLLDSNNMDVSLMGMDAAGMHQASYFMRDKIYTNKILAVVREYSCNAIDEHIKYDIKQPVDIGIRQEGSDTVFFVRDFAKGLNESDIRQIFGMYFRSTKSDTNNVIGGFGIGSKAGHCYGDTFFVASHFGGIKSTYTCMLGGGEKGVPVGHIYKIDECPTDESGLEVSMPIKKTDVFNFNFEIQNFVKKSPFNIRYTRLDKTECFPYTSVLEKDVDGFKFRLVLLDNADYSQSQKTILIQMGGVTYEKRDLDLLTIRPDHCLIVDVPIGSMTIPISRESFEHTPSNNQVIEEIQSILLKWEKEDLAQFKDVSLLDLIKDQLSDLTDNQYSQGEVFCARKKHLFENVWPVACNARRSSESPVVEHKNGLPILLLIPSSVSRSNNRQLYWINKVQQFSKTHNKSYYYVHQSSFAKCSNDGWGEVKKEMHVMCAKKLPYERLTKDKKRYSIRDNCRNVWTLNALELHNMMRDNNSLSLASNEAEALVQNEEYIKTIIGLDQLKRITIAETKKYGQNHSKISFYSNSEAFVSSMESLGWIAYSQNTSSKYRSLHDDLKAKEEKEEAKERSFRDAQQTFLKFSGKTLSLIKNNYKNSQRINKFWEAIKKEDSLRSKIIRAAIYHYGCTLSRKEFRGILKMK